jgi:hypothetical protein
LVNNCSYTTQFWWQYQHILEASFSGKQLSHYSSCQKQILFHYELILLHSDLQHTLLNWPGSQAYFSVHLNHHQLAVLVKRKLWWQSKAVIQRAILGLESHCSGIALFGVHKAFLSMCSAGYFKIAVCNLLQILVCIYIQTAITDQATVLQNQT